MSMLPIALAIDSRAARSSPVTGPAGRSTSSGVTFWLSAAEELLEALGGMCSGERDRPSFDIPGDLSERTTDTQLWGGKTRREV